MVGGSNTGITVFDSVGVALETYQLFNPHNPLKIGDVYDLREKCLVHYDTESAATGPGSPRQIDVSDPNYTLVTMSSLEFVVIDRKSGQVHHIDMPYLSGRDHAVYNGAIYYTGTREPHADTVLRCGLGRHEEPEIVQIVEHTTASCLTSSEAGVVVVRKTLERESGMNLRRFTVTTTIGDKTIDVESVECKTFEDRMLPRQSSRARSDPPKNIRSYFRGSYGPINDVIVDQQGRVWVTTDERIISFMLPSMDAHAGQKWDPDLHFVPNPARDMVSISNPFSDPSLHLVITASDGRVVSTSNLEHNGSVHVDLVGLSTGSYVVTLSNGKRFARGILSVKR